MTQMQPLLRDQSFAAHLGATLRLGLPLIASQLAKISYGVIDTIMLGWYSVEALAASVLATQIITVFMLFGSGFSHAVAPLVAERLGHDDQVSARRALRMGLWIVAGFFVITIPIIWHSEAILRLLGQDAELSALAGDYARIGQWMLAPVLCYFVLRSYLSALERANIVMWATIAGIGINITLNYAFIFGNWGAPELGVRGAAIASVGTGVFVFLVTLSMFFFSRSLRESAPFARIWRADWPMVGELFRLGWPISLMILAEVALFTFTAIMMGWVGTVELAAHGIALQVTSLLFMIPFGLSMAATARVGRAYGRGDVTNIYRAAWASIWLGMGFALVSAGILVGFADQLVFLFIDPADAAASEIMAYGPS